MPNHPADHFGALDGPNERYPPFDQIAPQPHHLVVNIYGGYTLVDGKRICITHPDQMPLAEQLQAALAAVSVQWDIQVHQPEEGRDHVGVQFEVKPLKRGAESYALEVEIHAPDEEIFRDGIISLIAHDPAGLRKGVHTLIQVIRLSVEMDASSLASLWIWDWAETK